MSQNQFPFLDQERYGTVQEIAGLLGIELRGEDGQPYCCGKQMRVKAGLFGPDYARCDRCGKTIWNAASPHVNGGILLHDDILSEWGDALWTSHQGAAMQADPA